MTTRNRLVTTGETGDSRNLDGNPGAVWVSAPACVFREYEAQQTHGEAFGPFMQAASGACSTTMAQETITPEGNVWIGGSPVQRTGPGVARPGPGETKEEPRQEASHSAFFLHVPEDCLFPPRLGRVVP